MIDKDFLEKLVDDALSMETKDSLNLFLNEIRLRDINENYLKIIINLSYSISNTLPVWKPVGIIDRTECPFCNANDYGEKGLYDLNHDSNCLYVLANRILDLCNEIE